MIPTTARMGHHVAAVIFNRANALLTVKEGNPAKPSVLHGLPMAVLEDDNLPLGTVRLLKKLFGLELALPELHPHFERLGTVPAVGNDPECHIMRVNLPYEHFEQMVSFASKRGITPPLEFFAEKQVEYMIRAGGFTYPTFRLFEALPDLAVPPAQPAEDSAAA